MSVTTMKVATEGAELYVERRGSGPLLLLIAGGNGDGGSFDGATDILADEYTVVNYDRRSHSRSTGDKNADMIMDQQVRDVAAIIAALGEEQAIIFGTSGGGVIGLEVAALRPELIRLLVIHETPVFGQLPDSQAMRDHSREVYDLLMRGEKETAMKKFFSAFVKTKDYGSDYTAKERAPSDYDKRLPVSMDYFFKHELLAFNDHRTDLARIRDNGVRIVASVGRASGDAYYVRAMKIVAEKLGCECVEFPGHHTSMIHEPEPFAATLRDILHKNGC